MDSGLKKNTVHFFSEFQEVVNFAQSLGISFLLIVPENFDEQKLKEDLRILKDTYGRRLADFEEESILQDFGAGKSFKVYVFETREDFEIEALMGKEWDMKERVMGLREEFIFLERRARGLEKVDAVFERVQGPEEFWKEEDYAKCKEFCVKRLKELVKQRRQEKTKLIYYVNLGPSFQQEREYQKAMEFYFKAFDIVRSIYSEKMPALLFTPLSNLAGVYISMGQWEKVRESSLKVLEVAKLNYGEANSKTIRQYGNLAFVHQILGERQKAQEYWINAIDIVESSEIKMPTEVLMLYWNLGQACHRAGEFQNVLGYQLKALEIRKEMFGEGDIQIANFYREIAKTCKLLERYQEVFEYSEKAAEIIKNISGEVSPDLIHLYHDLAMISQNNMQDDQQAIEYHFKALEIQKSLFGETNPKTASSYSHLGAIYISLGEGQKALNCHMKVLHINISLYGEIHPAVLDSHRQLAITYDGLPQPEKALEHGLRILEINKALKGETYRDTMNSHYQLALSYENMQQYQKGIEHRLRILEINIAVHGGNPSRRD